MIRRKITGRVEEALADTPVVALVGARQTGKTTLARELVKHRPGARYLTLDDPSTLVAAISDPTTFVRQSEAALLVIDEIQQAPQLLGPLKVEVDHDRRPGRCLITGSAHVLAVPQIADSLAGRMEILHIRPFSQGEMAEDPGPTLVDRLLAASFEPRFEPATSGPDLADRILRGGYPEVGSRPSGRRRSAWFSSYVTAIMQRDIRDLANIEGLTQVPRLLALLAARSARLLNKAELSRSVGLAYTTLDRYLALLEATFLLEPLPAWSTNLGKRIVRAPKVVLGDSGLAAHLMNADAERWRTDPGIKGALTETFVIGELRKQASWSESVVSVSHYRAGQQEVDVILENSAGRVIGIEIKAGATLGRSDGAGLRFLAESLGKRFHRGVVLYAGDRSVPLGTEIWAIPIASLWAP